MRSTQFVVSTILQCLLIVTLCIHLSNLEHLISRLHRCRSPCLLETVVGNVEKLHVATLQVYKSACHGALHSGGEACESNKELTRFTKDRNSDRKFLCLTCDLGIVRCGSDYTYTKEE